VIRWAKALGPRKPRVIILENVEEFEDWGPLGLDNRPTRARASGSPSASGRASSRRTATRSNTASSSPLFGAPTIRKRLYLIARCDGQPIVWPKPTHDRDGAPLSQRWWRTAAECIDWSIICPSIFERKRPLAENTQRRIARGIDKFVMGAAEPFIAPVTHTGDARVHSTSEPMRTITGRLAW
jgi:DNA (cytosine-5)-methyltransferase 1